MAEPYATVADLKRHWPGLPDGDQELAAQKLLEASIEVHGNYPDLDSRISDGSMDPAVPRLVVCRMVKRSMDVSDDAPPAGLTDYSVATGPFSFSGKLSNPDGNLYLTAADKRLLGRSRARGKAFTIHPGGN